MWDQPKIGKIIFFRNVYYITFLSTLMLLFLSIHFNLSDGYKSILMVSLVVVFPMFFWVVSFECPRCNEKIHQLKNLEPKDPNSFVENFHSYQQSDISAIMNFRPFTKKCVHCSLELK